MLTQPSIKAAQQLTVAEYDEKLHIYNTLVKKLNSFIESEAAKRASKLPSNYIDIDDLRDIGYVQTWIATVTWDPRRGASLENWAKRRIWTNMNVLMGSVYQLKRVPRVTVGVKEVTTRNTSLLIENGNGALLYESLPDNTFPDPMGVLIADDLYTRTRERLLHRKNRVAAAVLRLLMFPDGELLQLCEDDVRNSKRKIRITNRNLARRLGVSTCRVATARAAVRTVFKELSESD